MRVDWRIKWFGSVLLIICGIALSAVAINAIGSFLLWSKGVIILVWFAGVAFFVFRLVRPFCVWVQQQREDEDDCSDMDDTDCEHYDW